MEDTIEIKTVSKHRTIKVEMDNSCQHKDFSAVMRFNGAKAEDIKECLVTIDLDTQEIKICDVTLEAKTAQLFKEFINQFE